uniref:U-actitoxin-Ate1c acrorhagin Ic n=1 Tax=Actinia tenebrosa TaxID=6105 RepID=A0A3P8MJV9_ACTTE|nr:U-actitoxin-Ate1c acrorhagin Ic [Actinia tenebrosa]
MNQLINIFLVLGVIICSVESMDKDCLDDCFGAYSSCQMSTSCYDKASCGVCLKKYSACTKNCSRKRSYVPESVIDLRRRLRLGY